MTSRSQIDLLDRAWPATTMPGIIVRLPFIPFRRKGLFEWPKWQAKIALEQMALTMDRASIALCIALGIARQQGAFVERLEVLAERMDPSHLFMN